MNDTLLRPRSAIEIIDTTFALYRAHFAVLVAIALVLLGPLEIVGVLVGGATGDLISSLSGLFAPIVVGATVGVVTDVMHDRPVTIGSAFGQIAGRWGTLVVVSFMQNILTFLGLIFLVIPGILAICWTFAAPMAVVVEHARDGSAAISRSRQLARGQFWHILWTLVLAWTIVGVLFFALSLGIGFVTGLVGLSDEMAGFLGSWIFILLMPIVATASGVLYFDLRVRTEAYDIERLAESIGVASPPPAPRS